MKVEKKVIRDIEKLTDSEPNYWDFKEGAEKEHIHKLIRYPATMVPVMQSKLIELFAKHDKTINVLLDPFMGSGTTLVEANIKGIDAIGIDINPFAYLITTVKLRKIDLEKLNLKNQQLIEKVQLDTTIEFNYWFPKISKWFKPEIINELSIIKKNIVNEPEVDYRCVMWIAFARTVQYSSNDRESTFKLHAKTKEDIEIFNVDVKSYFIKCLSETEEIFEEYYGGAYRSDCSAALYCGDSMDILREKIPDNSVDIVSTSPPYGDNATTVTYGQYSMLQLRWIPNEDLQIEIDDSLLQNYSSLDRKSLGGIGYSLSQIEESGILQRSVTLSALYNKLIVRDEKKARKVVSFYIDYEKILEELFRVVKENKYLLFTVGNRKVDDEVVCLDKVTIELSEYFHGKCVYQFERNILNKRMPDKVSKLKNNKSVSSMKRETILFFKKIV